MTLKNDIIIDKNEEETVFCQYHDIQIHPKTDPFDNCGVANLEHKKTLKNSLIDNFILAYCAANHSPVF